MTLSQGGVFAIKFCGCHQSYLDEEEEKEEGGGAIVKDVNSKGLCQSLTVI